MSSYSQTRDERSMLGLLALAAAAISLVGIAIIMVGIVLDIEGAREGEEGYMIFEIAWVSFLLGGIGALVLGAIAFMLGRKRNERQTERAGVLALGYAAVAVVIFIIAAVLSS